MRYRNENVAVPERIESYSWQYVTADFDRTKPFTKVRISYNANGVSNWKFSPTPGINTDGIANTSSDTAALGWGNHYRTCNYCGYFGIMVPSLGDWTDTSYSWSDTVFPNIGTYIGTGEDGYDLYEVTYPITLYWSGLDNTSYYTQYPYQVQVYAAN